MNDSVNAEVRATLVSLKAHATALRCGRYDTGMCVFRLSVLLSVSTYESRGMSLSVIETLKLQQIHC